MRITKKEYLEAKKKIADYELEQLTLTDEQILEDVRARGFIKGVDIVFLPNGAKGTINRDPVVEDKICYAEVLNYDTIVLSPRHRVRTISHLVICNRDGEFYCEIAK